jgi:hypothetical protein
MLEQLIPVLFPGLRLPTPRIARVLHVTPNRVASFSLDSLKGVSEELTDFRVDVDTITVAQFPNSLFADPGFLRKTYDVVFVGGVDSAWLSLKELTADVVTRSFAEYHRMGGNIVLLHDVCALQQAPNADPWFYFLSEIGPLRRCMDETRYRFVSRVSGRSHPVLSSPFLIPDPMNVGETHAGQTQYHETNVILCGPGGMATPYYAERDGLGFCEAGHTPSAVTRDEMTFWVNVVYHFSSKRPRQIR